MKKRPLLELAVLLGIFALFVLSWAVVAGFEASGGAPYEQALDLRSLARYLSSATLAAMRDNLDWVAAPWFLAGSLLAFCAVVATLRRSSSRWRAMALGLQLLIVWPGWWGLFVLPFAVLDLARGGYDAEWLAEAWPPTEVAGFWIIASALLLRGELKALRAEADPH